jgi:segregation and condensation protein A
LINRQHALEQALLHHHRVARLELESGRIFAASHLAGIEFENLFNPEQGVPVLVVTFIALLELAKETLIEITQAEAYAPIYVRLAFSQN